VKLYSRPGNDLTDRFSLIVPCSTTPAGWGWHRVETKGLDRGVIGHGVSRARSVAACANLAHHVHRVAAMDTRVLIIATRYYFLRLS
jgi:hypothetical protein